MNNHKSKLKVIFQILFLLVIFVGIFILLNIKQFKIAYYSYLTGYQEETISVFLEEDIYDEIIDNKYSRTLEEIVKTDLFEKKFLLEYLNINYIESENFLTEISSFLSKGYNNRNINMFYETLTSESVQTLLEEDYFHDIDNIINITFFKEDKLKRYLFSKKEVDRDLETIVTYVNIGLDNPYYTNIEKVDNQDDFSVLVNKYNQLDKNYIPKKMQNVSYGSGKLREEVAVAFDEMCKNAKKDGIKIYGGSGYRSYDYQNDIYDRYVARDGKKLADTYSARAGHSEHQTGLAMDILNKKWEYIDESDKEYEWLINNSYKYGFILRYLKGKEEVTGYKFEPWHYRYVGMDIAKEIYDLNITYDEYIARK